MQLICREMFTNALAFCDIGFGANNSSVRDIRRRTMRMTGLGPRKGGKVSHPTIVYQLLWRNGKNASQSAKAQHPPPPQYALHDDLLYKLKHTFISVSSHQPCLVFF